MTVKEVQKRLTEIVSHHVDHEYAHQLQDQLFRETLQSIADDTCDNPQAVAAEALKVLKIHFPRVYA